MQYPAALRNTQPLHVANRGGSTSVETLTGPAPPRYTSQRNEGVSGIPAKRGDAQNDNGDEDDDEGSSPSLSMHSFLEDDSYEEALLSAHSVEDLGRPRVKRREETDNSTAEHAYPTDSSVTTLTPPPSDTQDQHSMVNSTSGTISASGLYSHESQTIRYAKHYSMPTNPSASVPVLARSSEISPSPAMYRQTHSSQPTGIGQMTYRQPKTSPEVYRDANDDILSDDTTHTDSANRSQPLAMGSTATFLPEDANSQPPQFRSRAELSSSGSRHRQQSSTATQKSTTSTIIASQASPGRATNYVSLARKSTIKKSGFFRHASVPSSITGKFTIDPSLHISPALLKALETPSTLVSDVFPGMRTKGAQTKTRTQNLHLEVENGGIDVDIHLIPPPREYMKRRMTVSSASAPESRPLTRASTVTAPPPVKPPFMSEESYARSGWANLTKRPSPLGRHSLDANTYTKPPSPPPPPPAPVKKYVPAGPLPTLLDLRLKEVKNGKSRKDSNPKKGKEFGLIARIHAPNPRPPFHLLASTVDIIPYTPSALGNSGIPPPDPNSKSKKPFTRPPRRPAEVPYSRSQSRSPLTLHLPRTFRGPVTVNISAGNIDEHVRLSQGLAEASVVLAESAYSRGYFVGRLAPDEEKRDLRKMGSLAEWTFIGGEEGRGEAGTSENGERRTEVGEGDAEIKADDQDDQEEEWIGDKVDIFVGSGKVFLQLLGEEDPFGKKGFWSRVMGF